MEVCSFFAPSGSAVASREVIFHSIAKPSSGTPLSMNSIFSIGMFPAVRKAWAWTRLPSGIRRSQEILVSTSMYHPSVTVCWASDLEPSRGICFLVVMICLAAWPKNSFRSPVSTVVISIRRVGLPEATRSGTFSPRASLSSLLSGFGG